jgi:uncharacterized protein (TIGR03437 family)
VHHSRVSRHLFTCLVFASHAVAQVITTLAGTAFTFPSRPLPAINAPLGVVPGVAVDGQGNVYVADASNNLVYRIAPNGTLTVVAGNGTQGFSGDGGPATSASLFFPTAVAVDSAGNLYIADEFNDRIRMVSGGIITTVVGNGDFLYSGGDGGSATASAIDPFGVAVDSAGNLYIADFINYRIRKVTGGIITTIAGNGTQGFSGDGGLAIKATLDLPNAVAVDSAGNVYIADNNLIRKVSAAGIITTIAGNGTRGFSGDGGPGTSAELDDAQGVAVDSAGNVYIADTNNNRIRELSGGIITTIAGNNRIGFDGEGGPATQAALYSPQGVAVDSNGNVYIADTQNVRVRKISDGIINTIAGNSAFKFSGDGGPAPSAALNLTDGVAVDSQGTVYIADTRNNRIRSVSGGIIRTVAGTGEPGYLSDGVAANRTNIWNPVGVAVDSAGNLYVADTYNNRIRKVSNGIMTTIAGNGLYGFSGDGGPATSASLGNPTGVAVDSAGNVYIADASNDRIRKVSGGIITTIVEGLFLPDGVAVDAAGNVYIADTGNNVIRKVSGDTLTTVAGTGPSSCSSGFSGDGGPATSATLCRPSGVAVDFAGNIYIADQIHNRIRKVAGGIITTIAGNGTPSFSGDGGPPTSASLNLADASDLFMTATYSGVAVDSSGNVYIADTGNDRIRVLLTQKPSFGIGTSTLGYSLSFSGQSHGAPAPVQVFAIAATISGVLFSIATDASSANWLSVSPSSGAMPSLVQVTANPANLSPGTYQGTITAMAPDATAGTATTISVTFTVAPGTGPSLSVDKTSFSFPYARTSAARGQSLTVSNTGTGTLNFNATATTNAGGNWLSVSSGSGTVQAGTPVALSVTADPTGLAPQTYTGQIAITSNGGNITIPVTLAISSLNQAILLSQSGFSFTGISQGGIVAPQSFAVKNIGTGVVSWSVSTSTLSGGPNWLMATPGSGMSDASAPSAPTVQVSVNPASLAAGKYYGLVRVDAPGAANSPQVLSVFLQVLAAGTDLSATVQPAQLVFSATAGAEAPGSQNLLLYNVTATGKTYNSSLAADPGLNVIILPPDGTLDPQNPGQIVVQPFTQGLAAGIYHATLTLQFDDGRVIPAKIQVIVASAGGAGSTANGGRRSGEVCTPTKLIPTLTSLSPQFQVPAGPPISLIVDVRDDCTNPPIAGSVVASFSNGDDPITLDPSGSGRFEASWNSGHPSAQLTITLAAADSVSKLTGTEQVTGGSQADQDQPVLDASQVVSSATAVSFSPIAPGGLITIYGSLLGDSTAAFSTTPLTLQLGDTQVYMAGQPIPLLYVSPGQINAIVPAGININAPQQVLVQRGSTYSVPVTVNVASAQPSLFAANGQAIAQAYRGSAPPFLVSTQAPATAGDVLVLYTAGLGATNPGIVDGAVSPVANTVSTATVSIGGQNAPVQYAGLTPGFVGLYQVNAVVPSGVATGNLVQVTISIAGQTSPTNPPVTLAVE